MSTTTDEPIVRQPGVPFQERPYVAEDGVQFVVRVENSRHPTLWGYMHQDGRLLDDRFEYVQDDNRAMKFRTPGDAHSFMADSYRYDKYSYKSHYLEVVPVLKSAPTGA